MRRLGLLSLVLALLVSGHAWALDASIKDIVASPERFDGQAVTLRGTVASLRRHVSRKGNAYFTIDLSDGTAMVRVFSFGQTSCQAGTLATVNGRFDRTKTVGGNTFHNEVTATSVACR